MIFSIQNLRASRVNLLMNDYAAGIPSPLSFLGLGDALARKLNLAPWTARAIPVLHSVFVSAGRTKPEMEKKSTSFSPIETMEDLVGTVDLSLLLDLPGCDSVAFVRTAIDSSRIAGGVIQSNYDVEEVARDGSAFRSMRRGYLLIRPDDEKPERLKVSGGDLESLTNTAATIFPVERSPGNGWVVPVAVGYRLLESPEAVPKRIRTRSKDVPHVFAEPLLGIAELVSVRNRRITQMTEQDLDDAFWKWHTQDELILGHRNYTISNNEIR